MAKHFKSKRRLRHDLIIKYLLIVIISYIVIRLCLLLVLKTNLLELTFTSNKIETFHEYLSDQTLNKPNYLLNFYQKIEEDARDDSILATYITNTKPLVYIYNTHQKEAYQDKKTVLDAANKLKEELANQNINVIVEDRDITEFMRANNISYPYSYYASKFYVEDILSKNKVDLLIDLHRDAVSKKNSTVTINKKDYAKILFVVGKEHSNYKVNYALATSLNDLIKAKYPTLTKGITLKSGSNVNGIYNQDLSSNSTLIEIGGNYNTYEEVCNTLSLLAPIIGDYLYEKK